MKKIKKESFIEIRNTYKRFISILIISLLGVGFFAGIKATSPDMQKTADTYFDKTNMMDIEVLSTLGITDEDITEIEKIEGVSDAEGAYSKDIVVEVESENYVIKMLSIGDINQALLKEGRMPERDDECIVEAEFLTATGKQIGDKIILKEDEEIKNTELEIVGTVTSPLYIDRERGSTKLGSGKINYYILVPKELFAMDVFTEMYLTVEGTKELLCFEEEYEEKIEQVTEKIEQIAEERKQARYEEIVSEARKELDKAKQELEEETQKANQEIEDAKKQIENAKKELEQSEKEINQNKQNANQEFKTAEERIQSANEEIETQEKQLQEAQEKVNSQYGSIENAITELENNRQELQNAIEKLQESKTALESSKTEIIQSIENLKIQLENTIDEEQKKIIEQQIQGLEESNQQLETNYKKLSEQLEACNNNMSLLASSIQEIQELQNGIKSISDAKIEIQNQAKQLQETKTATMNQIENAIQKIDEGKEEIAESEKTLEEETQKAEEEIQKAQTEIDNAEDDIKNLEKPEWYILDRNSNIGYINYSQDTERIANIGKVFPIVFFIVAALISLNSMTRMVEEQRGQIGLLKALGYNKFQIASKYILYAFLATVIGGILGMFIGFRLLPDIIFDMYKMMYALPDIILEFNMEYAITGLGFAILCIVGATIYSCTKELKEVPAILMRPKAPKMGKRVLLERIPILWSHLKFTQKVTVRNIFRYKKRFLMTIIGICGCTGLIVAGFGLRDSISSMIPEQYGEIFKYSIQISIKDEIKREDIDNFVQNLPEEIQNIDNQINGIELLKTGMQSGSIEKNGKSVDVQIIVPENAETMEKFIRLKNNKETYQLAENEIVLTEKAAKLLNVKIGDEVILNNADNIEKTVKIGKITENYLMHYIYMTKETYKQIYEENIRYNAVLVNMQEITEQQEDNLAEKLLEAKEEISSITFTSTASGYFDDVMNNMNFIVWILIVAAGLLAFVVLYNLANVNISERIRELATIKVLGFYDGEVYKYIARESIILTIIGIIIGLVAGYFLNLYILQTCELDMLMFVKKVEWPSYALAVIITTVFTIIVNIITYFALKKIDMIESLKSVE